MNLSSIADAFNTEISGRANCTASIERKNLVIRRFDGEKMIIMGPDGFIAIMPGNRRRRAAKRLIFELRYRYEHVKL